MRIRFFVEQTALPLRYAWKLSRNTSTEKQNFIIRAERYGKAGLGEVAPNVRYQETPERVAEEFERLRSTLHQYFTPERWLETLENLSVCHALKMGLDMAFQRLVALEKGITLSNHLELAQPRPRAIAYTIPVMEPSEIKGFIQRESLDRFSWLKVKVNRELALPMLQELARITTKPMAIDGNEAWTNVEDVLDFAHKLNPKQVLFLEQPLPAAQTDDYRNLLPHSPIPIWGDESVLDQPEPEYWKAAFTGINVKLMKAGSFANAIRLLKTAKQIGLQTMVGCMVETTVGISAALELESLADYMDLDGFLLIQNEPYGIVQEQDGVVGVR